MTKNNKQVDVLNQYDTELNTGEIDTNNFIIEKMIELEKSKIELATKFQSLDVNQKTEISSHADRVNLAILEMIAHNPYQASNIRFDKEKKKVKSLKDFKLVPLEKFLEVYYKLGIPMGRKGRTEEVKVISNALNNNNQFEIDENKKPIWKR